MPMPGTNAPFSLLDAYGRPYRAPADPLDGADADSVARVVHRDIPITTLADSWTVERVREALAQAELGMFFEIAQLIDAVIADDRVHASLGSRVGALFGLPEVHREAPNGKRALKAWRGAWKKLNPSHALAEVKRWAIMLGFGVAEILWDTSVTPWQPYLKPWHPMFMRYDFNRRCLMAATLDGEIEITPGDGRWFVHAPHGLYRGWMFGVVRAIAEVWLQRRYAARDWARYCERHGIPIVQAIVPTTGKKEDKARFVQSLAGMGTESVVMTPQDAGGKGYDVKMIEAHDRSWEAFKGQIERCDTAITLAIQWQNLTTEVKEGSLAAGRVHADVKQSCLEFDARTMSHDTDEQLGRPYASFNFGDANLAPSTGWDVEPVEDRKEQVATLESFTRALTALRTSNVDVDVAALAEAYNLPLPLAETVNEAGEKVVPIFAYHMAAGVVTVNEVRARLGLPPRDDGDVLLGGAKPAEEGAKE